MGFIGRMSMTLYGSKSACMLLATAAALFNLTPAHTQQEAQRGATSYAPVDIKEAFSSIMARFKAAKPAIEKRQADLLADRYDLSNRAAPGVTMSRGKPVQEGVRVKLPAGTSWDQLAGMSPTEILNQNLFPNGFYPLPHPNHPEGGMLFPKFEIEEIKKQEGRDLARFDLDFDLPDQFLPEFPAPIYLTTRPDLGDVSQGKLVTIENYYELFNGILNPKQIEGLRLLVTPSLRGVYIQRLFGSQRALKSVEDFTEFEQRAAYFDGDPVIATKKGVNILERGSQVHDMAEFQELLDFPPAPKLDVFGKLDPQKATPQELHGQEVFFGKGKCASCHEAPYYTDNLMHNLHVERFYKAQVINGLIAPSGGDGPIKTEVLRGLKDTPTYFHDGRLMTLDDTVEFFNLILGTNLIPQEKKTMGTLMLRRVNSGGAGIKA